MVWYGLENENIAVATLKAILEDAGKYKGIGDWRPKHGRFKVTSFEKVHTS
jgi:hypothetical protein